jgi:uncharacterized protein YndB with AHSA1/START domain
MKKIKVDIVVKNDINAVWKMWNEPKDIVNWAFASDAWECPYSENDLKVGGKFLTRMSAKDGSASFDFTGIYTNVVPNKKIEYTIDDGRKVSVDFEVTDGSVKIVEEFEMENMHSEEMQREGWQSILHNFKKYSEK